MKIIEYIKKFFNKENKIDAPWLSYYSREDRSIKFTKKSIYEYMMDSSQEYKNNVAINYFNNKILYTDLYNRIS